MITVPADKHDVMCFLEFISYISEQIYIYIYASIMNMDL